MSLEEIFARLLKEGRDRLQPIYDLVLIDEAQDFGPNLFETVYHITKDPKRIVWAYDEFQSLGEFKIREPENLFGKFPDGTPHMPNTILDGCYSGGIEKDLALKNCYRNPRITLMVAHGCALGLYRKAGIIDIIEDKKTWESLGYQVLRPQNKTIYEESDQMLIERPEYYSRNTLEQLLKLEERSEQELIKVRSFLSIEEQLETVASQIAEIHEEQGVPFDEIVVITLDKRNADTHLLTLRQKLDQRRIPSIAPGIVENASRFKDPGFVTLTTPFRAKGNETNVVFVINAQQAVEDVTFWARNALFVSMTRTRGWCFVFGTGEAMDELASEIFAIERILPRFEFTFPNPRQIERRRSILRREDIEQLERDRKTLEDDVKSESKRALLVEILQNNPELWKMLRDQVGTNND